MQVCVYMSEWGCEWVEGLHMWVEGGVQCVDMCLYECVVCYGEEDFVSECNLKTPGWAKGELKIWG